MIRIDRREVGAREWWNYAEASCWAHSACLEPVSWPNSKGVKWCLCSRISYLFELGDDLRWSEVWVVPFYFTIPRRPVSLQAKNSKRKQAWRAYIQSIVGPLWSPRPPLSGLEVSLTLVYLSDKDPLDVDNIIKPIQDALVGIVFDDDFVVTDVSSHRRDRIGPFDVQKLPAEVLNAIYLGTECVVGRVSTGVLLEDVC